MHINHEAPHEAVKAGLVLLILPFIFLSCSSIKQIEKTSPLRFAGTTLSKAIATKAPLPTPVDPTSTFLTEDQQIIAHVKIENLSGKHKIRWDWYDPEGNLYTSSGNFPITTAKGTYSEDAAAWHTISIRGEKAEDYPGQWEVRIFMDNKFMGATPFMLKAIQDIVQLPPHVSQKPYPNDWGLIIGIENYAHLPKVAYAKKDALIVKDYFMKVLGVPERNIILLIDVDATKARLEGYLKHYLPENLSKDANLYVYFAGHGAPDMKKGDPYLVPFDGDTRFIAQTGYSLTTFYQDLGNLNIERTYVFMDSCFSGVASRAADMLAEGTRPALVHVIDVKPEKDNLICLSASESGQISNAYPEAKHGLFTFFLLRALRGDADENDDRLVSVKEVYNFVKNHVITVSRRIGSEQTPVIAPSLDILKDIAICNVIP